ncbi:hypothetical protein DPMN_011741 [Dreissena polymorpha]|uniref:MAM and LDL-receptor class A domain-containing protein 2 n=1 Tax=Dreissena polymorpha TaxID=45954 RepID=A0A9D4N149_DREPO|nr:hypothetical protein DPMN_011741 [Dreissena polymorpha]
MDHTDNNVTGKYMFVDSSKGTFAGNADLLSPTYGNLASNCQINFAYYTTGDNQGFLRLYLISPGSQPRSGYGKVLLWTADVQNSTWQTTSVVLGARAPGYQLLFEAVKRLTTGAMAIDDVSFSNCQVTHATTCNADQFSCGNSVCVGNNLLCDFSNDCGDGSDEASCSNYVERCSFERDICNWVQDDSDDFNWSLGAGSTATTGTGPSYDHTFGNTTGHYIFIESSSPQQFNDKARIVSPVFVRTTTGTCRMRFFFNMYGVNINALNIYTKNYEFGPMVLIWNLTGQQQASWLKADISLTSNDPFRVIVEATVGNGYRGDIAIDDISFTPGCTLMSTTATLPAIFTTPSACGSGKSPCQNGKCISSLNFCNFRDDCGDNSDEASCPALTNFDVGNRQNWINDPSANFQWQIGSNGNPTALTGPTNDHTTGTNGTFLYTKGIITGLTRVVSRLISPIYNQAGKTCNFTFWYNVHGREFVNINIYLKRGVSEDLLAQIGGGNFFSNPDTWKQGTASLPVCSSSFQIIVETSSLGSYQLPPGFVAIDDLQFQSCEYSAPPSSCLLGQFACSSGHCVDLIQKCDFQTDCCDGSDENKDTCTGYNMCDFEYSLCGWQQLHSDALDWTRHQGPTSTINTGPPADHTTGSPSGYYLYIESSIQHSPGDAARLTFSLPVPTGDCAIRFWYYMYGTDIGSLNVYQNSLDTGTVLKSNINGTQGQKWTMLSVSLDSTVPYTIIIEGVIGQGYHGDIAIDDISLTPGCGAPTSPAPMLTYPTLSPLPNSTPVPCPVGQYTCASGQCINASLACNARNDCADMSDETRCAQPCSFETDSCGWMESMTDGFDWIRSSAAQAAISGKSAMAPPVDNTRVNQNGYFMYVMDSTNGNTQTRVAQLVSPTLYSANQYCKMQFSYYLNGQDIGQLRLSIQESGSPPAVLWRIVGSVGAGWKTVTVELGKHVGSYIIMFTKLAGNYNGQTAIDDIQFLDCVPAVPQASCPSGMLVCTNKACVGMDTLCDMTNDCGDNSDEDNCGNYRQMNFEAGLGDLSQGVDGQDDDFDWITVNAPRNITMFPGPPFDHTYETNLGKYMYIDSTQHIYNSRAWLVAGTFPATQTNDCQIRLYLFMYGANANTFSIYYRLYNSGPPTKSVYSVQGEQGPYWQRISIPLIISQPFQIIIEALAGNAGLGGFAIDDVSFTKECGTPTPTQLPTPPTTISTQPTTAQQSVGNCTTSQFSCGNTCLDLSRQCDFKPDCPDQSDELHCVKSRCTFDNGDTCGWTINSGQAPRPEQSFAWQINQAALFGNNQYSPKTDHSQSMNTGWYAFATSSRGSFKDTTELYTSTIGATGPQCSLKFFYYMNGPGVDSLIVYATVNGIKTQLFMVTGSSAPIWQAALIFVGPKNGLVLTIQARRGMNYQGGIAVDDLQFVDCQPPFVQLSCRPDQFTCTNKYCIDPQLQCNFADDCGDGSDELATYCDSNYQGRCDFSFGICFLWRNDVDDDFDWTLAKGSTPTLGTGPSVDHTTRTQQGGYLLLDNGPPQGAARLSSMTIKGTSTNCVLRLWYHMWGQEVGHLTVLKRFDYEPTGLMPITDLAGDHGNDWMLGTYVLDSPVDTRNYQIVIQGSVGTGIHNDIGLDDISLTPGCERANPDSLPGAPTTAATTIGKCGAGKFTCNNQRCYALTQRCDFVDDCGDNTDEMSCGTSCDFERNPPNSNMCGWRNTARDNSDFSVTTATGSPGPQTDHTSGSRNGHYLIVQNGQTSVTGDTAILESDIYYMSSPACSLTFWYNTNGATGTIIRVLVKQNTGLMDSVFMVTADNSNQWKQAVVKIGAYSTMAFQLLVIFPSNAAGQAVAIDDISFMSCAPVTLVDSCPTNQWLCASHTMCIPRNKRCDLQADCLDGSDESNCIPNIGDCNFDDPNWLSVCNWAQSTSDDADWMRANTRVNQFTGPLADHRGAVNGYFLLMDSSAMESSDIMDIQTPTFPSSFGLCSIRFYYYMFGSQNIGPLRIYTLNSDNEKNLVWSVSGDKGENWNYANVLLGNNKNFSVIFEAQRGDQGTSDIAIDDVTFTPECAYGVVPVQPTIPICNPQVEFFCVPRNDCLPNSWMCDGTLDCSDGTDEPASCPTTTLNPPITPASGQTLPSTSQGPTNPPKTKPPTTTPVNVATPPATSNCARGLFQCGSSECIPGLLQCDNVTDCLDGTDEVNCKAACRPDFVYCRKLGYCIINKTRCDNADDCGDGSDEVMCSAGCRQNFCQNGGSCSVGSAPPVCACPTGFIGTRCQYPAPNSLRSTGGQNNSSGGWKVGVGATFGVVLLIVLVVGAFFLMKKYRPDISLPNLPSLRRSRAANGGLSNPVYEGYGSEEHTDFHMDPIDSGFPNNSGFAFANSLDPDETPQNVASHQDPNFWSGVTLAAYGLRLCRLVWSYAGCIWPKTVQSGLELDWSYPGCIWPKTVQAGLELRWLHMALDCAGWSEVMLAAYGLRLCRLVWSYAGCIWPKTVLAGLELRWLHMA